MEQGRSQIKGPQIGALLRGLGIDDPKLEARLVQLAELSHDGGQPYDQYRESLSNEALQFFGYEGVPTAIRDLQIVFVPGLLQSDDYAREVIRSVQGITGDIEGFLSSRRDRQAKVIFRDTPPSLSFMIDEAVLYRPFGSAAIMGEQLRRLQELAERPDISIKVVPLAKGASPALRGSFTLLEFDKYPDVLFIEGPRGDLNVYRGRSDQRPPCDVGGARVRNSRPSRISTTTYEGRLTNYSAMSRLLHTGQITIRVCTRSAYRSPLPDLLQSVTVSSARESVVISEDGSALSWRRSSACAHSGCVEVQFDQAVIRVRSSRSPSRRSNSPPTSGTLSSAARSPGNSPIRPESAISSRMIVFAEN